MNQNMTIYPQSLLGCTTNDFKYRSFCLNEIMDRVGELLSYHEIIKLNDNYIYHCKVAIASEFFNTVVLLDMFESNVTKNCLTIPNVGNYYMYYDVPMIISDLIREYYGGDLLGNIPLFSDIKHVEYSLSDYGIVFFKLYER